jgi:hypothetical protein
MQVFMTELQTEMLLDLFSVKSSIFTNKTVSKKADKNVSQLKEHTVTKVQKAFIMYDEQSSKLEMK